ncbi:SCO3374 family protein [Streptomyces sp. NPDC048664]|uniref:SCO3374 family protein n=1 Tax=Streptomyces sp. NPDC048664 TaxID=3154505 RepID=UPI003438E77A
MVHTVPLPREPLDPASGATRLWYEEELGWATLPGEPVRLVTGVRFDVLEVPSDAGFAALRHLGPTRAPGAAPVALCGARMLLLVAAGSAEELPGLLAWLEWGSLAVDLTATGAGGHVRAPRPPRRSPAPAPASPVAVADPPVAHPSGRSGTPARRLPLGRSGTQGDAVWLRPPAPGCEAELWLPTLSAVRGEGDAPDLVRLVDTVAAQCHRVRLRRSCAQPFAFS